MVRQHRDVGRRSECVCLAVSRLPIRRNERLARSASERQNVCLSLRAGLAACAFADARADLGNRHTFRKAIAERSPRMELEPKSRAVAKLGSCRVSIPRHVFFYSNLRRTKN